MKRPRPKRARPRRRGRAAAAQSRTAGTILDVAERGRLDETLGMYQRAMDQAADAIFWLGPDGEIVYVNDQACRWLGCDREAALRLRLWDIDPTFTPASWRARWELLDRAPGGVSQRIETLLRRRDGTVFPIEVVSTHIPGAGGTLHVGYARDITARRQAEEALRVKDHAIATSINAIAITDAALRLIYVNPAFLRAWGYGSEAEVLGRRPGAFAQRPEDLEPVLAALHAGKGWLGELVGKRKDGTTFDVQLSASAVLDDQGRLSNVMGSFLDVTARRHAEEARERLAAILDATPDFVAISTPEQRRIYLNRAARALLRIGPEEDVSKGRMGDAHPEWARRQLLDIAIPTAVRDGVWRGETAFLDPAGREIPHSQVIVAHRRPDGQVAYLSTIARDLSEQKRLEAQLVQAQRMEAIGRLAGGVAHDFNNLLTVISGHCDIILSEAAAPPAVREDVEIIRDASRSAAGLTRQLLAFSRKQVLQPRVVDLSALLANTDRMLRRVIGEDVRLELRLEPDLWMVRADSGQLEQVVMNLVVNSRDAMPRGGTLTLETANVVLDESYAQRQRDEVRPGGYVMLAVSDTGEGMDAETAARAFEPFFTTKKEGRGTGLGLSTVYGIVRQSGGHVTVASQPGRGTAFRVYLPRDEATPEPEPEAPAHPEPSPSGQTVLLAEDSDGVRLLIRQVLERAGYGILEARSGEEALSVAARHPGTIDLLVTDVVMPGMGGREMADRLAAQRPGLRSLFMSGYTEDAILAQGVLQASIDFIEKPFTPSALLRKVQEVLGRSARPG